MATDTDSYLAVTGPCNFSFPGEHGSHPGYKTEWWYYTGNVKGESGVRFGFQLTFFRRQISPPGARKKWPHPSSPWRTNQIYIVHSALSDLKNGHFYYTEDMGRDALGISGTIQRGGKTKVFVKSWYSLIDKSSHKLHVSTEAFSFDLLLRALKQPVAHGIGGYSLKGAGNGHASCYYSLTRLSVTGIISLKTKAFRVTGTAWMDHEYGSSPLEKGIVGWDWFSLQLSDGTELMLYLLRRNNGGYSVASSGTFVDAKGKALHLQKGDFSVRVTKTWPSPHTGAKYPAGWHVIVPSCGIDLFVEPNLSDQEMLSPETTRINYWEGSVSASGVKRKAPISAVGYVELTGYDRPLHSLQ